MAVLAVIAVIGSACSAGDSASSPGTPSPSAQRGGTLTIAVPVSPSQTTWDPRLADSTTQRVLGPAVMATLLRPTSDGSTPVPWLADSAVPDATARVWTITLRDNLRFSNGAPFLAADVVFMLEQAAGDPILGTRFGTDAEGTWFKRAKARDDRTIVITLRRGNAALDRLVLASPEFGCLQAEFGGRSRAEYFSQPPSCGPFALESRSSEAGQQLALIRNEAYFAADQVLLDRVLVDDALEAGGTADLALDASRGLPTVESATPAVTPTSGPPTTTPTPVVATTSPEPTATAPATPDPQATTPAPERWSSDEVALSAVGVTAILVVRNAAPGSDANLRQALRASLDYNEAVQVSPGSELPASGLTPNGWAGAISVPVPRQRLDIARLAIELVPEESRTIDLVFEGTDAIQSARAASLAGEAASVGFQVELRPLTGPGLTQVLESGEFDAALTTIDPTAAHTADVSRLWALTGGFGGRWSSAPGQVAYPLQITRPQEPAIAAAGTARFEELVRKGVWAFPLAIDPHRVGARAGVQGVQVGTDGSLPLDRLWLSTPN